MEYQFSIDFTSKPVARCSMDHEAFGHWLTEEVSTDITKISKILENVQQLQKQAKQQYILEGSEYSLKLTPEDAFIGSSHIGFDEFNDEISGEEALSNDFEFEHGELALDDQQGSAMCGLEDFKEFIQSWRDFL